MKKKRLNSNYITLVITSILFIGLFAIGSIMFTGFFSVQVFMNLFIDNAFLIVIAVGMTMVIITCGIDLSVGAVMALTCMITADMLQNKHMSPWLVIPTVILVGAGFGFGMGVFIHYLKLQPFIVTLTGMFLARGLTYMISTDTIQITNKWYTAVADYRIPFLGGSEITINVVIALIVVFVYLYIAHFTKLGRNAYAIGGNEQSAKLMGLPVARTKIAIYTLSGICSAIAGIIFSFYTLSGYGLHGLGLEMDAIASAVIGGTLLTGGVGLVAGTVVGVITYGVIQTLITFQGTLSSWWARIVIAALLCGFIVLQRLLTLRRETKKAPLST
jgi:ribose/xylose/arabinose/galactoside ABC-type transport system permease subunit